MGCKQSERWGSLLGPHWRTTVFAPHRVEHCGADSSRAAATGALSHHAGQGIGANAWRKAGGLAIVGARQDMLNGQDGGAKGATVYNVGVHLNPHVLAWRTQCRSDYMHRPTATITNNNHHLTHHPCGDGGRYAPGG